MPHSPGVRLLPPSFPHPRQVMAGHGRRPQAIAGRRSQAEQVASDRESRESASRESRSSSRRRRRGQASQATKAQATQEATQAIASVASKWTLGGKGRRKPGKDYYYISIDSSKEKEPRGQWGRTEKKRNTRLRFVKTSLSLDKTSMRLKINRKSMTINGNQRNQ